MTDGETTLKNVELVRSPAFLVVGDDGVAVARLCKSRKFASFEDFSRYVAVRPEHTFWLYDVVPIVTKTGIEVKVRYDSTEADPQ